MVSLRAREEERQDGRRARELYRYFQPEKSFPATRISTSASDTDSLSSWASLGDSALPDPPSPALPAQPGATDTAGIVHESLTLGEYNATLTSFAQLAALRLNVERVMIRCAWNRSIPRICLHTKRREFTVFRTARLNSL